MLAIERLADAWATRWALHSLPAFESPDPAVRQRRNVVWNWGYLAVQVLGLATYLVTGTSECGQVTALQATAFALAVYGWLDLSLCVVRKTFLLHLRTTSDSAKSELIGSAWLMLVSLTVIYANLYFMLSMLGGKYVNGLDAPWAALALSASTITTVGYGYYSPVGSVPVALAYLQALSGIALVSCVIAAAVSSALGVPDAASISGTRVADEGPAHHFPPWLILLAVFVSSILFATKAGCLFGG
jgi:hypothetical protein